jgi:hypothetical protein
VRRRRFDHNDFTLRVVPHRSARTRSADISLHSMTRRRSPQDRGVF